MTIQFDSIIIGTRNIELAKAFYMDVFGFQIDTQSPYYLSGYVGGVHVEIEEDAPYRFPSWAEHNIGTYKNSEFLVSDISEFLLKVTNHGGSIISGPTNMPWGSTNAEIGDLDGNIFPIHQR